ncbi:uncharacterized protein F5147DRAFT_592200, partial [Suillus discolor]
LRMSLGTKAYNVKHILNVASYLKSLLKYIANTRRFASVFGDVVLLKEKNNESNYKKTSLPHTNILTSVSPSVGVTFRAPARINIQHLTLARTYNLTTIDTTMCMALPQWTINKDSKNGIIRREIVQQQ